jgi:ankyrin repeat protein
MHQPAANASTEDDGMDVDVASDDEQSGEAQTGGRKRGREHANSSPTIHGEPILKRRRTEEDPSPQTTDSAYLLFGSTAPPSTSQEPISASSATATSSSALSPQIRMLTETEANNILFNYAPDEKLAIKFLFGESQTHWPAEGYTLLDIFSCPEEIATLSLDCGAKLLFHCFETNSTLMLIPPEFDRGRFQSGLLQVQYREPSIVLSPEHDRTSESDTDDDEPNTNRRTTALMIAAQWGDEPTVTMLLENGGNPNRKNMHGKTALMTAVRLGHQGVVRQLMHLPTIDPNLMSDDKWDALTIAAEIGNVEICSLLFFFGVSAIRSPKSRQPLICAAKNGHHKVCELLIRQGADIDATSETSPKSALWYAAQNGHLECCQLLIARGASAILQDEKTVLIAAAKSGNLQLFNWLLEIGVPLNGVSASTTPLLKAVQFEKTNIVRRLIELEVNLDEKSEHDTPLTLACKKRHTEIASLLLEAGADPLVNNNRSDTPLKLAARAGNVDLLSLMTKKGVRLKNEKSEAYFALSEAIYFRHLDAVKFLLENGTSTVFQSTGIAENRPKALIHVLLENQLDPKNFNEILDLLLTHQAPINEVDKHGNDALMSAAFNNRPELLRNLLRHGASIGQKNINGENALSIAIKNAEIVLQARGVPYDDMERALTTLAFIIDDLKRTSYYFLFRNEAFRHTENRIIREMLPNVISTLPLNSGFTFTIDRRDFNISKFSGLIKKLITSEVDNFRQPDVEEMLFNADVILPMIDFIYPYLKSLPAMKSMLLGSSNSADAINSLVSSISAGLIATAEKVLADKDAIDLAYQDLGWLPSRIDFVATATSTMSAAVASALRHESKILAPVFSDLFEHCVIATTALYIFPELGPAQTPKAGVVAEKLMGLGVYAALADAIDAAWRDAWRAASAVNPQRQQNTSTSSASTAENMWNEFSDLDLTETITSQLLSDVAASFDLRPNELALLRQSFASALAPIIDTSKILKLPGASPEVNGLYADLMHRQLHMLAQFRKGLAQTEAADALAGSM